VKLRTIETDPQVVNMNDGDHWSVYRTITTVRLQIRVFGKWLTLWAYERIC